MSEVGWKMRTSSEEFARLDALCRQLGIAYSAAYRLAVEWHAARTGLELDSTGSHIAGYSPLRPGQVSIKIARSDKWVRQYRDARVYRAAARAALEVWVAAGAPLLRDQSIRATTTRRPTVRSGVMVSCERPARRLRSGSRDESCAPRSRFVSECEAQSIWPVGRHVQPGSITGRPYVGKVARDERAEGVTA